MARHGQPPLSRFNQPLTESGYETMLASLEPKLFGGEIDRGNPNGMMANLARSGGGYYIGVGPYSPGQDLPTDLDIRATYGNNKPMARKHIGQQAPGCLHLIVDATERVTTGNVTLRGLSRLAIAATSLAAEYSGSQLNLVLANGESKFKTYGYNDGNNLDPSKCLKRYDQFKSSEPRNRTPKNPSGHAFTDGLKHVSEQELYDPRKDFIVVVSDFIEKATIEDGIVQEFSWRRALQKIHERVGDRLAVVKTYTPAFDNPPRMDSFLDSKKKRNDIELRTHLALLDKASELGAQKQNLIRRYLRRMRSVELNTSSTDEELIKNLTDILYADMSKH